MLTITKLQEIFVLAKASPVATLDDLQVSLDHWRAEYALLSYEASRAWSARDEEIDRGAPADELQEMALAAEILQARAGFAYHMIDTLKVQILERGN